MFFSIKKFLNEEIYYDVYPFELVLGPTAQAVTCWTVSILLRP
jgi:hypothetical protein